MSFWSSGQTGLVSTHAQQLIKDMKSSYPKRNRKFKLLTGDSVVDTNTVPHPPPLYDKPQIAELDTSHSITLDMDTSECNSPIKHSLLDGCYDETESAESFQAALNEWRSAGSDTGTGTDPEPTKKGQIIDFPAFSTNTELTYFDRLMLLKYKSEIPKSQIEEQIEFSNFEELAQPPISEYNIFYSADLKIEQETKNSNSLVITEITESEDYEHSNGNVSAANSRGNSDTAVNSRVNSDTAVKFKTVTQTDLTGFFLLGTEVSDENNDNNTQNNQTAVSEDSHSIERESALGQNIAWNPSDSVTRDSHSNSTDSDSSDSSTLEDFGNNNDGNVSEDEDILTLEKLSNELAEGDTHSTSGLWTELMCHRPPTSSDFT